MAGALAAAIALALAASSVEAATINVDGTSCTLQDAITAANDDAATGGCTAGAGADTLVLQNSITLASATPNVTSQVLVQGNGFTIGRSAAVRTFTLNSATADLTLDDVVLDGAGLSVGAGSALRVQNASARLVLQSGTVVRNFSGNQGAMQVDNGTVTVDASTLEDNTTTNDGGAAVRQLAGSVTLRNGTLVRDNQATDTNPGEGGALYVGGGTLTVDASTLRDNSSARTNSTLGGGALFLAAGASAEIRNASLVEGNTAANYGGGIYSNGTLTVTDSTIRGNGFTAGNQRGGGIYANGGTVAVTGSTISDHALANGAAGSSEAALGGGIYVENAPLTLDNSVVSGNRATGDGGGIYLNEPGTISQSTVSNNSSGDDGGGLYVNDATSLSQTTISGNSAGDDGGGVRAGMTSTPATAPSPATPPAATAAPSTGAAAPPPSTT